jgi:hypothetical protein
MRSGCGDYAVKAVRGGGMVTSIEITAIPIIVTILDMNFVSVSQDICHGLSP